MSVYNNPSAAVRHRAAVGRILCLVVAFAAGPVLLGSGDGEATHIASTGTVGPTSTLAQTATQAATGTPQATSYLIVEVDTSTLAPTSSLDDAIGAVQDIIRQRAEALGAGLSDIERQGTNRLAFEVSGVTVEEARDTLTRTGLLEFKEPQRDQNGDIVCRDSGGQTFPVPPDTLQDVGGPHPADIVTDANGNLTLCQGPGDATPRGSVVWTPAKAVGNDGVEKALTGEFLLANSKVVFDALSRPLVAVQFNAEGGQLFDQMTGRLVGLPMAIFLDNEIVSAPTILTRIEGGSCVITGLTADEARTLAIQLNSGALPAPVRVIAAGEGSLP